MYLRLNLHRRISFAIPFIAVYCKSIFAQSKAQILTSLFCNRAEKPYVPGVWRYFVYFLTCECKTDQPGVKKEFTIFQERKSPIKVSATHSYPVIGLVERNHRREDDIEHSCGDKIALFWLENSESIRLKFGFRDYFPKIHLVLFFNYRDENALFHVPCARNYCPGVHFVGCWQVAGNVLSALKPGCTSDFFGDFFGCDVAFCTTHFAARGATESANVILHV